MVNRSEHNERESTVIAVSFDEVLTHAWPRGDDHTNGKKTVPSISGDDH